MEIYATNECVKFLLELTQIYEYFSVKEIFMPGTNSIYNDNQACINWSKKCTTKGLRHIQMKENLICENIASNFVNVRHVCRWQSESCGYFYQRNEGYMPFCRAPRSHDVFSLYDLIFHLTDFFFEGGVSVFQIFCQSDSNFCHVLT